MKATRSKRKKPDLLIDLLCYSLGAALYAFAAATFIVPNHFAPGGVTGISTIFNYLFQTPVGLGIVVLNIPLLLLGYRHIGLSFIARTAYATVLTSVLIDVFSAWLPAYTGDRMLAALYGGVVGGFGLALVILRGGTTGGTDILARLIQKRFPYLSMGRILLVVDFFIVAAAVWAFGYIEAGLYSIITIFASSRIIDGMLYGADMGKIVMIISSRQEEISRMIFTGLKRGATIIDAKGAYTGAKSDLILCAVRNNEVSRLHKLALQIDPKAFIIVSEAGEILGEGFKQAN